jgi:hypothetical protein
MTRALPRYLPVVLGVATSLALCTGPSRAQDRPAAGGPLFKLDQPANCLAFSPDGKTLACGYYQNLVLRDVATGKEVSTREAGKNHAECTYLAFSPDGKRLASVHFDRALIDARHSICLWTVSDRNELRDMTPLPLPEHRGPRFFTESLHYLAFSPDGRMLATRLSGDETVVWETATGKERVRLPASGLAVAFGADGKTLISVSRDGQVLHWDLATKECVAPCGDTGRKDFLFVNDAVALADGTTVALTDRYTVVLKDARSGKTLCRFPGNSYALSAGGKTLAAGGVLFDAASGRKLGRLGGEGRSAFSPDGKWVGFADEKTVSVWDPRRLSAAAKPAPESKEPPVPLEVKVTSRKESYVLDLGKTSPEEYAKQVSAPWHRDLPPAPGVDLVLTFRNTGDKAIALDPEIQPRFHLVGGGAVNHPATPYQVGIQFLDRPEPVTLAPGATHTVHVNSLECGSGGLDGRPYWVLPGEYALHVKCFVSFELAGRSRFECIQAPPVRLKVIAGKK